MKHDIASSRVSMHTGQCITNVTHLDWYIICQWKLLISRGSPCHFFAFLDPLCLSYVFRVALLLPESLSMTTNCHLLWKTMVFFAQIFVYFSRGFISFPTRPPVLGVLFSYFDRQSAFLEPTIFALDVIEVSFFLPRPSFWSPNTWQAG